MGKKPKGFGRFVSQKRWDEASDKSSAKLQESLKRNYPENVMIVKNHAGIPKMSEVLTDFFMPYADISKNKKDFERLLGMAVTAWNMSFSPEDERSKLLDQVFAKAYNPLKVSSEDLEIGRAMLENMIERKLDYFADYDRQIIDFSVEYLSRGNYHLSVASSHKTDSL